MKEMQSNGDHGEFVKEDHDRLVKACHDIVVDVALDEVRIDGSEGEIEQVIDDEQQDEDPAVDQRAAGDRGLQVAPHAVAARSSRAVSCCQLHGSPDVQDEGRYQNDAYQP